MVSSIKDFEQNGSSIYLLVPLTPAAQEWIDEFLPEDAQRLGTSIAIEHRYIDPIIDGVLDAGLESDFAVRC